MIVQHAAAAASVPIMDDDNNRRKESIVEETKKIEKRILGTEREWERGRQGQRKKSIYSGINFTFGLIIGHYHLGNRNSLRRCCSIVVHDPLP